MPQTSQRIVTEKSGTRAGGQSEFRQISRVLVLGFENTTVSVMCEELAKKHFTELGFAGHISFESAGIGQRDLPIDPKTMASLKKFGILGLENRVSRQVSMDRLSNFDTFFCTDSGALSYARSMAQKAQIFDLTVPGQSADIRGQTQKAFNKTAQKMDELVRSLAQGYQAWADENARN